MYNELFFEKIYDFSKSPEIVDLFKIIAMEGFSKKVKEKFDSLISSKDNKDHIPAIINLALCDIFQNGAVIKAGKSNFFPLKKTNADEARKRLDLIKEQKLKMIAELEMLPKTSSSLKEKTKIALCRENLKLAILRIEVMETKMECADFLRTLAIDHKTKEEREEVFFDKIRAFLLEKNFNAFQVSRALEAFLSEEGAYFTINESEEKDYFIRSISKAIYKKDYKLNAAIVADEKMVFDININSFRAAYRDKIKTLRVGFGIYKSKLIDAVKEGNSAEFSKLLGSLINLRNTSVQVLLYFEKLANGLLEIERSIKEFAPRSIIKFEYAKAVFDIMDDFTRNNGIGDAIKKILEQDPENDVIKKILEQDPKNGLVGIESITAITDLAPLNAENIERDAILMLEEVVGRNNTEDLFSKKLATNLLGTLYAQGKGVEQNIDKAFEIFTIAESLGSVDAKFNLATCYLYKNNPKMACQYYEDAARCESYDAIELLAKAFEEGNEALEIKQDLEKAYQYFKDLVKVIPKNKEEKQLIKEINRKIEEINARRKGSASQGQKPSDEDKFKAIIASCKKDRREEDKRLLNDLMINFFLKAVEEVSFAESIFSRIEDMAVAFKDIDQNLSLKAQIITNIKKSLILKDAKKRTAADKEIVGLSSEIAKASGENHESPQEKLFWSKVSQYLARSEEKISPPKADVLPAASAAEILLPIATEATTPIGVEEILPSKLVEAASTTKTLEVEYQAEDQGDIEEDVAEPVLQLSFTTESVVPPLQIYAHHKEYDPAMKEFLASRSTSRKKIESSGELPIFLQEFIQHLPDGAKLLLKGSATRADCAKAPNDLDIEIMIKDLGSKTDQEIKDYVKEKFGLIAEGVYRNSKKAKAVSINIKCKDIDISFYDADNLPNNQLSWITNFDAQRVAFNQNGNAQYQNISDFDQYVKQNNFQEDVLVINPSAHNLISRLCLLYSNKLFTQDALRQAIANMSSLNLGSIANILNSEFGIGDNETKLCRIMGAHNLDKEQKVDFIKCLGFILDQAAEEKSFLNVIEKCRNAVKSINATGNTPAEPTAFPLKGNTIFPSP